MELRVLSGPQAGCRLPLSIGTYRAGADETCDVVLEGMAPSATAFVIYVGQRSLGLESLSEALRANGRVVSGLIELVAGQLFELGQWVFAVDDPQAPWPSDVEVEALRAKQNADGSSAAAASHDDDGLLHEDLLTAADRAAMNGASDAEPAAATITAAASGLTAVGAPAPVRRKVPFWVIGLAGTAAFLVCGVLILVMSLAPAQPAAAARAKLPAADALARLVATTHGDVQLERMGDRIKLVGTTATRAAKLQLTRDARAIEPTVLLQVTADEDLDTLAHDAMSAFPHSGIELSKFDHGHLVLTGHVSGAKIRDQVVAALSDGVPGLAGVDSHVLCGDEVLASFNSLLSGAGLTKHIAGVLDPSDPTRLMVRGVLPEAERTAWAGVREQLNQHFGASLTIVEEVRAPDAIPLSTAPIVADVIAIVRGPMPYELLRDGSKRALPASVK